MCRISFDDSPTKGTVTTVTNDFVQRGSIGLPIHIALIWGWLGLRGLRLGVKILQSSSASDHFDVASDLLATLHGHKTGLASGDQAYAAIFAKGTETDRRKAHRPFHKWESQKKQ
jgi:hypothetical protein